MRNLHTESLEQRSYFAVTASFVPDTGLLTVTGDADNNTIVVSRNAAGTLFVNGNSVDNKPGNGPKGNNGNGNGNGNGNDKDKDKGKFATATIANTTLIQVFGLDGNDTITL